MQLFTRTACILFFLFAIIATSSLSFTSCNIQPSKEASDSSETESLWYGWNKYQIKPEDSIVRLGHAIIENTCYYFGPKGKISTTTNGMNCQNCHLDGGILPWGNNFSAVIISYPKFSNRNGSTMSLTRRINDCFERSLNGIAIDTNSHEMKAIVAYMHWLADDIPANKKPLGSGIERLPYLERAADTVHGEMVYVANCVRCHGTNGKGQTNFDSSGFIYPPLWGSKSYNTGAGLYRISLFAGFVKNNMPFLESTYDHPKLTDEEAWDVAAFINSKPRPAIKNKTDYPDISKKEVDTPFGPYRDTFSEAQHKYGPYKMIATAHQLQKK